MVHTGVCMYRIMAYVMHLCMYTICMTCMYIYVGMEETFGSTCHGAGRAKSRNASRKKLEYQEVGRISTHYIYLRMCMYMCMYMRMCVSMYVATCANADHHSIWALML